MIKGVIIDSKREEVQGLALGLALGQYKQKYQEGTARGIEGKWVPGGLGHYEKLFQGKESYQLGQTL